MRRAFIALSLVAAMVMPAAAVAQSPEPTTGPVYGVGHTVLCVEVMGPAAALDRQAILRGLRRGTLHISGVDACAIPGADDSGDIIRAVPRPDLLDVHEVPWTRLELGPDGTTLDVYFGNGVPDCFGLADASAATIYGAFHVSVSVGRLPGDHICILPLLPWVTTVQLAEPLVTGGDARIGGIDFSAPGSRDAGSSGIGDTPCPNGKECEDLPGHAVHASPGAP